MLKQKIGHVITLLQENPWYAFMLVFLAFASLLLFVYEVSSYARPEIVALSIRLDLIIASLFMVDFLLGLFFNKKYTKRQYWRHNWLDFIASIPLTADAVRILRIFRVWRAIRVIEAATHLYVSRRRYRSSKGQRRR